jgi:hypothetical protein
MSFFMLSGDVVQSLNTLLRISFTHTVTQHKARTVEIGPSVTRLADILHLLSRTSTGLKAILIEIFLVFSHFYRMSGRALK